VLGPDTGVVSLQNGVDNEEILDEVLGAGRALGGAAFVFTTIESPGVIAHTLLGRIVFGELDGRVSERATRLRDALARAGVPVELSTDVRRVLWEKYLLISAQAGTTALTRAPIGVIRDTPETWRMYRRIVEELAAVARAAGVTLSDGVVDTIMKGAAGLAPTPSPRSTTTSSTAAASSWRRCTATPSAWRAPRRAHADRVRRLRRPQAARAGSAADPCRSRRRARRLAVSRALCARRALSRRGHRLLAGDPVDGQARDRRARPRGRRRRPRRLRRLDPGARPANGVARLGSRFAILGAGQRVEADLRDHLYAALQTFPPEFFARHSTGDLMTRASE